MSEACELCENELKLELPSPIDKMNRVLANYEKRLIGESRTKATRRLYLLVAKWMLKEIGLGGLKDEGAVTAFRDRLAEGHDQNSVRTYACAMNAFLKYVDSEVKLVPPKAVNKVVTPATKEEIKKMLAAAQSNKNEFLSARDTAMMLLIHEGAGRAEEVQYIKLRDVDLAHGEVIARSPKGKHDRRIPFGPVTTSALRNWLEIRPEGLTAFDEECLFLSSSGKALTGRGVALMMVKRLAAKAGIERSMHPHLFRHARLTELASQGVSPFVLRDFAGHTDLNTTLRYVHYDQDAMRTAIQAHPSIIVAEEPKVEPKKNVDELKVGLATRLALGEIDGETYNRALTHLESAFTPLEALR